MKCPACRTVVIKSELRATVIKFENRVLICLPREDDEEET